MTKRDRFKDPEMIDSAVAFLANRGQTHLTPPGTQGRPEYPRALDVWGIRVGCAVAFVMALVLVAAYVVGNLGVLP